jgi:multidrug resistance efflux pump
MKVKALLTLLLPLTLAACGAAANTAAPLPTVVLGNNNATPQASNGGEKGGVTASGVIVPAQQAQMAFVLGGIVKSVYVAAGDPVQAGQVLVELDNNAAQLQVDQASRTLRELTSQAAIAAAEQAVAAARQGVDDAQKKVNGLIYPRASDELIKNTEAEIDLARDKVATTSNAYRSVEDLPDGDSRKATALAAMTQAQMNLNRLIANYNWYTGKPSDLDVATAQANLDAAKAAQQEAEWLLAALKGEAVPQEATGSGLAQLQSARDALAAAQDQLENTKLVSPFAGIVAALNVVAGEYVAPGQYLVTVIDASRLHVETTDLSERDVPNVKVGQAVTVSIKALGQDVTGKVTAISPLADTLGGDVVYKTTVALDTLPPGLRAGMSVEVQFNSTP